MKKVLMTMVVAMMAMGCGEIDDMIYDYKPVEMSIMVTDPNGSDLLDPENSENVLDDIEIMYDGKSYRHGGNKALPPTWFGLVLVNNAIQDTSIVEAPCRPYVDTDGYYMVFGQWDGGNSYNFSLDLKLNGKVYNVAYKRKVKKLDISEKWTMNGNEVQMPLVIIKR